MATTTGAGALFPGATGITHLRVYDWPTSDGLAGGSPHLHTASTEGYLVVRGSGVVQCLSGAGYTETPLVPGVLLWFTPGTVHRLVSTSGDLEIVVVMQNAGLPEAGDAVLTFPPAVLEDPSAYAEAVALPRDVPEEEVAAAARRRRDLAIEGYLQLRARVLDEGPDAMAPLYEAAVRLVRPRVDTWRGLWWQRPFAQAVRTGEHLEGIGAECPDHLGASGVFTAPARPGAPGYGMCGRLRTWDLDAAGPVPGPGIPQD